MIPTVHIDVGAILQASRSGVYSGMYTDLVTRATGRTVRTQIEMHMAEGTPGTVAIIDFSNVGLLDFSCADEIVATLMRRCCTDSDNSDRYLLFAGITDGHLDAIEHVLERNRLALIVRFTGPGAVRLVGVVHESERLVWETVARIQPATHRTIADAVELDEAVVRECLDSLHRQRLLMRDGHLYHAPIGAVT